MNLWHSCCSHGLALREGYSGDPQVWKMKIPKGISVESRGRRTELLVTQTYCVELLLALRAWGADLPIMLLFSQHLILAVIFFFFFKKEKKNKESSKTRVQKSEESSEDHTMYIERATLLPSFSKNT